MATSAPVIPSTQSGQLCDYCHQKPKFSNHSYCSKTCAGQAAALCNHCHKKPKFQNFEFCGKNCAALANPQGAKPRNPAAAAPQYGGGSKQTNTNSNGSGTQGAFDPVQLAKLVAQHIPQVQAMFNPGPQAQVQAAPAPAPVQPKSSQTHSLIPHRSPQPTILSSALVPLHVGAVISPPAGAQPLLISTQQSANDLECLIPGCGQPVHADAKGVRTSDYCSMRHREEAVAIGLASPCIMCLTFPQSESDYFCSRGCREESLNKHGIVEDEGSEQ
ncbi:hypothetical protein BJ912DRAFT_853652 [Pholiota molesta]|nr:hypothetical protein BJ912DRAFT_853652 [Pholiota molesta]